ncbi:MAG TPA: hypothetical protein P5559_07200 [Candidatus Limiplasma sp.]|nr:hypothetical protein [Candidatus Limiplasma sp.]
MNYWQIIFSVLTLLGIGGIVGGCVTYFLDKKKERDFRILEQKLRRYRSCLLYMDCYFVPENIKYLSSRQPDINSSQDVIEYLKAEYHEMMLYASKGVILFVKEFICNPSYDNYLKAILSMRQDLFRIKDGFHVDEFRIEK